MELTKMEHEKLIIRGQLAFRTSSLMMLIFSDCDPKEAFHVSYRRISALLDGSSKDTPLEQFYSNCIHHKFSEPKRFAHRLLLLKSERASAAHEIGLCNTLTAQQIRERISDDKAAVDLLEVLCELRKLRSTIRPPRDDSYRQFLRSDRNRKSLECPLTKIPY